MTEVGCILIVRCASALGDGAWGYVGCHSLAPLMVPASRRYQMFALNLFKTHAASMESALSYTFAVVPNNGNDLAHITRAIHLDGSGNLRVTMADGSITVTFAGLAVRGLGLTQSDVALPSQPDPVAPVMPTARWHPGFSLGGLLEGHVVSQSAGHVQAFGKVAYTAAAGAEIGRHAWSLGASGTWDVFDLYEMIVYTTPLSNVDAQAVSEALMKAHRIVPVTNQLVLEGDSITQGTGNVTDSLYCAAVQIDTASQIGGAYAGWVSVVSTDLVEHNAAANTAYYADDSTHLGVLGANIRVTGGDTPQYGVAAWLEGKPPVSLLVVASAYRQKGDSR